MLSKNKSCNKIGYMHKSEALAHHGNFLQNHKQMERYHRTYPCEVCKRWHITTEAVASSIPNEVLRKLLNTIQDPSLGSIVKKLSKNRSAHKITLGGIVYRVLFSKKRKGIAKIIAVRRTFRQSD